jgi:phage terminase large subunit GpA-like protein
VSGYADIRTLIREALAAWKPPPRLSLSQWADEHFYLSQESSAEAGRWRCYGYQKGILDAITDPEIDQISVMKSARVGYTKCLNAAVGYFIEHDPSSQLVVQPTVDDAKGYSKEEIAPMLRDCPSLARIVVEEAEDVGPKDSGNTILHKKYPGGVLSMVGANSGAGFRRISRRFVAFDEIDAYPPSAGSDGDQIELGIKRTLAFWNRKILAGSTPLIAGASRIERLFLKGDQRRYFVPCPQCGHMAPLVFNGDKGHSMKWPKGNPKAAYFSCQLNGCVIEHSDKFAMVEAGEWRPTAKVERDAKGRYHASFHIWAAYSYLSNAEWGTLAVEWVAAQETPETLKTFVNTVLGETWRERGEAPDWERLYGRRERYAIGTVPAGAVVLTAGVDVQKDRFVYEVVGWGVGRESWSIEVGVLPGDPANERDWAVVDELLGRVYPAEAGGMIPIRMLAVDSGYQTNAVYGWARRHPLTRVIACKGSPTAVTIIGAPSKVEVTSGGRRVGYRVWPIGVDKAKEELYGWLGLKQPLDGDAAPPGYCHFPEYDQEYFKQLTAEQLVPRDTRLGFTVYEWQKIPGRENHWLDCRVLARAAAMLVGLDRMAPRPAEPHKAVSAVVAAASAQHPASQQTADPRPLAPERKPNKFQSRGDKFLRRGKGWLR